MRAGRGGVAPPAPPCMESSFSSSESKIENNLAAHVEGKAGIDSGTTAAFSSEISSVDNETSGDNERKRATVDSQNQDSDEIEQLEVPLQHSQP